jgi:mannobiose 2-epimerase
MADAMERALWGEVVPLYRHGLDESGFVPRLDGRWRPVGGGGSARRVVQAARMLWTAAELVRRRPAEVGGWDGPGGIGVDLRGVTDHGTRTLLEKFVDRQGGGLFWEVDASGRPTASGRGRTHAYGVGFAIYALANAGDMQGPGDAGALDGAMRLFGWLERHALDHEHGGYRECFERGGTPVADDEAEPGDSIGRPAGYKSMNTHIHLLEAFTRLFEVTSDASVGRRVVGLVDLVLDRMVVEPGCTHQFFTRDWRPVPGLTSYGHDVELGYLLVEAVGAAVPGRLEEAWRAARMLTDHALAWGFDAETGALHAAGPAFGAATERRTDWWAQAEAVNAFSMMHERFGSETGRYFNAMAAAWRFADGRLIDHEHGGWWWSAGDAAAPVDTAGGLAGGSAGGSVGEHGDKANGWKTAYHTGRAMLNTADRLRRFSGSVAESGTRGVNG